MTTTLSPTESLLIGLPALLLGLALLFYGYRVFRVLVALLGAVTGFLVGVRLPGMGLLWGLVGALVGLALVVVFYRVGVFLVGALVGFLLVTALAPGADLGPLPDWALPLAAAVAAGIVALVLERPAIIVATAFDGAFAVWAGAGAFAGDLVPQGYLALVAVLALAAVGAVVQWRWTAEG